MVETLIYYDGDKLQVDKEKNIIYSWYDYKENYEEWFKTELSKEEFNKFLKKEKSLYDILIEGKTFLFHRNYVDNLEINFSLITDFSNFRMPTKDTYLNF